MHGNKIVLSDKGRQYIEKSAFDPVTMAVIGAPIHFGRKVLGNVLTKSKPMQKLLAHDFAEGYLGKTLQKPKHLTFFGAGAAEVSTTPSIARMGASQAGQYARKLKEVHGIDILSPKESDIKKMAELVPKVIEKVRTTPSSGKTKTEQIKDVYQKAKQVGAAGVKMVDSPQKVKSLVTEKPQMTKEHLQDMYSFVKKKSPVDIEAIYGHAKEILKNPVEETNPAKKMYHRHFETGFGSAYNIARGVALQDPTFAVPDIAASIFFNPAFQESRTAEKITEKGKELTQAAKEKFGLKKRNRVKEHLVKQFQRGYGTGKHYTPKDIAGDVAAYAVEPLVTKAREISRGLGARIKGLQEDITS